jgi:cytochrome c oxidase accessory protein FixG
MSLPAPSLESVTTIGEDGSRRFIHPARAKGRFNVRRGLVMLVLIAIYVLLPWIDVNGSPAVFMDVARRQFHFFGFTLVTQDLWLGFFLITGLAFSLFYVTSLFGRIWCGWACPQTVFLEVARRIEAWIEGEPAARRLLDRSPWTGRKTLLRALKHAAYAVFATMLAHVFLAYFVSLPVLYQMISHAPGENWTSFVLVAVITGALWFNFAWFREQFCIVLCPYGRLQGALIDKHSMVIGYDEQRGEPRGKKGTEGAGDCVDCRRCVAVCPTGIDIRQGQQIECIGCAACIDVCDEVMQRISRPKGLIRYDSLEGLAGRRTRWIRPRTILYTALLLAGMAALAAGLSTLRPAAVSLLRLPGAPYVIERGDVRNQFLLRVVNKQHSGESYRVEMLNPPSGLSMVGAMEPMEVEALGEGMRPLVFTLSRKDFRYEIPLRIRIHDRRGRVVAEKTIRFIGPITP